MSPEGSALALGGQFDATRWSLILAAGDLDRPEAGEALDQLCRSYWYPLYVFVRRRGHNHHDAQDLTQGFLSGFVAARGLASVSPYKGRFRSYLLASLKNYLANEWDQSQAMKRGGGKVILSWDELNPDERYRQEPDGGCDPEKALDREWARTVVAAALRAVKVEFEREGTARRFDVLSRFLPGAQEVPTYGEAALELEVSESAVKSAVHRMRRRFADLFRAEIMQTVIDPQETEAEIRHLFGALVS